MFHRVIKIWKNKTDKAFSKRIITAKIMTAVTQSTHKIKAHRLYTVLYKSMKFKCWFLTICPLSTIFTISLILKKKKAFYPSIIPSTLMIKIRNLKVFGLYKLSQPIPSQHTIAHNIKQQLRDHLRLVLQNFKCYINW